MGAVNSQRQKIKLQLINFLVGQAKLAIGEAKLRMYMVKRFCQFANRNIIDFGYYKAMKVVETFVQQWCYNDAICTVVEGELCFDILWC